MSISSIIFLVGGFIITAVCEPNNDGFDDGGNGGDWALKNWFCEGGWKLFKQDGGSGAGGGTKNVDGGGEGGGNKPLLFSLFSFQVI